MRLCINMKIRVLMTYPDLFLEKVSSCPQGKCEKSSDSEAIVNSNLKCEYPSKLCDNGTVCITPDKFCDDHADCIDGLDDASRCGQCLNYYSLAYLDVDFYCFLNTYLKFCSN